MRTMVVIIDGEKWWWSAEDNLWLSEVNQANMNHERMVKFLTRFTDR